MRQGDGGSRRDAERAVRTGPRWVQSLQKIGRKPCPGSESLGIHDGRARPSRGSRSENEKWPRRRTPGPFCVPCSGLRTETVSRRVEQSGAASPSTTSGSHGPTTISSSPTDRRRARCAPRCPASSCVPGVCSAPLRALLPCAQTLALVSPAARTRMKVTLSEASEMKAA